MSRTETIMTILREEGVLADTPRLVEEDVRRRIAAAVDEDAAS